MIFSRTERKRSTGLRIAIISLAVMLGLAICAVVFWLRKQNATVPATALAEAPAVLLLEQKELHPAHERLPGPLPHPPSSTSRVAAPARSAASPPVDLDAVDAYMANTAPNQSMSSAVRRRLDSMLAEHQLAAGTAIDCRGSICKIRIEVSERGEAGKLRAFAPLENTQFTYQLAVVDNKITATVYRTAPGLTFAQILTGAGGPR